MLFASIPAGHGAFPSSEPRLDGRLNPSASPEIEIIRPKNEQILKRDKLVVWSRLKNFKIRPGGPHLHLVLDNQPFAEHFDPKKPFVFRNLAPGTHLLAIFLVSSWHGSWKDDKALACVRFHVKKKTSEMEVPDISRPLLIFNMPEPGFEKSNQYGILFDNLLLNAKTISGSTQLENYRIRFVLDGTPTLTEYWEPRFWLNLTQGEHQLEVELTDRRGQLIPNGKWNYVRRSFKT